jgi:hypothetical protein
MVTASKFSNAIVQGNVHIDHQRSSFGPCELCQIDQTRGRGSTVVQSFHVGYDGIELYKNKWLESPLPERFSVAGILLFKRTGQG